MTFRTKYSSNSGKNNSDSSERISIFKVLSENIYNRTPDKQLKDKIIELASKPNLTIGDVLLLSGLYSKDATVRNLSEKQAQTILEKL